jgi:hypothetical protein
MDRMGLKSTCKQEGKGDLKSKILKEFLPKVKEIKRKKVATKTQV